MPAQHAVLHGAAAVQQCNLLPLQLSATAKGQLALLLASALRVLPRETLRCPRAAPAPQPRQRH